MNKISTSSGFECEISNYVLDDWDLLETLRKIDKGESQLVIDACILLLGAEQYNKLKEHLRKDGKLKATEMMQEFAEIMTKTKDLKN